MPAAGNELRSAFLSRRFKSNSYYWFRRTWITDTVPNGRYSAWLAAIVGINIKVDPVSFLGGIDREKCDRLVFILIRHAHAVNEFPSNPCLDSVAQQESEYMIVHGVVNAMGLGDEHVVPFRSCKCLLRSGLLDDRLR